MPNHHDNNHKHGNHPADEPLDYNYIDDGIFVGTNQCCSVGLSELLKEEGITADVSLEEKRIDQPNGVDMYTWIPTVDHYPPSDEQLEFGVDVLKKLVDQERKIYVHCKNGHGRSNTLVSAYFVVAHNLSPEGAIAKVKEARPTTHLSSHQMEALERLHKKVAN